MASRDEALVGRPGTAGGEGAAGLKVELSVLDDLPAALILLREGRITWANRAARLLPLHDVDPEAPPAEWPLDEVAGAVRFPDGPPDLPSGVTEPSSIEVRTMAALLRPEATAVGLGDGATLVSFSPQAELDTGGAERRLETLLAHTDDIITVIDGDGTIRFSNPAAAQLTGLTGEVNGTSALSLVHPDDQRTALSALQAVADGSYTDPVEVRIRMSDGQWHHMAVSIDDQLADPSIAGLVVTLHDVTERVRHAQALEARERWLRSLVENLSDVVVVLGPDLKVRYASPGIESLIDAPAYTNIGETAFNDMHPDDVDRVSGVLTRVMGEPDATARVELRLHNQRHGWRWVDATVVNRLDDPAVEGLVCTLRDITEHKEAGVELEAAFEREREAVTQLRAVDRLKDEFLSTVSHELRTPLTSITGFAHLLQREGIDEASKAQVIERIAANAAEMQAMIEQLLDFSRLQAGTVTLDRQRLRLDQEVVAIVDHLEPHLRRHTVTVEVPPQEVIADRSGLAHVLRNLLTNAARYSDAGSTITIRAERDGGDVIVAVEDEGVGIAPEDQTRVFQRFVQIGGGTGAKRRGTGVGLNVARRYVQLLGGRMWLESTPGKGSTFFFTLSLADPVHG